MRLQKWATIAVVLLSIETHAQSVTISTTARNVEVAVSSATSLKIVLATLCLKTRSDCDGIELASDIVVPSGIVRGGWTDVISKLIAGSSLDFIAVAPTAGVPGRLILQPKTASTETVAQPTSAVEQASEPFDPPAQTAEIPETSQGPVYVSVNPTESSSVPNDVPRGGASTDGMGLSRAVSSSPLTSDQVQPTEPSASYFPFPDSQGQLIPIPPKGGPVPFPAANGQLIPTPQTSGTPFPVNPQPN